MNIAYNPQLDAMAFVMNCLYPTKRVRALRLLVDYKGPDGVDCNMDMLANVPRGMATAKLIKRVREDLPDGCTLSAICSVDYARPLYIAPGFLEECIREHGGAVPDDPEAAMAAIGMTPITLEEIFKMDSSQWDKPRPTFAR